MDENPYKSPEHVEAEPKSPRPEPEPRLGAVFVGMGASLMLFLTSATGLMLVVERLGVADWFRFPIDRTDPERGWAFWFAFPPLLAVSALFGLVVGKRHLRKTKSAVDPVVVVGLLLLMCVLVVLAYLTDGFM